MECIVLAGGLGTRLRSRIGEVPKCMAPVNDKPFLHYVFEYLKQQSCDRVILSLGYKHEIILNWLETEKHAFEIDHVIEQEALGTGGGIRLAMKKGREEDIIVLNGDTMFKVELPLLRDFHTNSGAEATLALKLMKQFDRYGSVKVDSEGSIDAFEEKKYKESGLINGGVYIINRERFLSRALPMKFSFEKDYLEAFVSERCFYGQMHDDYFIDIGIPEDYIKAQEDFKQLFS